MCVILLCKDKKPSLEILQGCEEANPHGAGYAYPLKSGKIYFHKGLNAKQMFDETRGIKTSIVYHFRFKTVGEGHALCHPFPVSEELSTKLEGEEDMIMFHNGHYGSWKEELLQLCACKSLKIPDGNWSDSRALAFMIFHYGKNFAKFADEKLCIMFKDNIEIYKKSLWDEEDGIWYSSHMRGRSTRAVQTSFKSATGDMPYAGRYWQSKAIGNGSKIADKKRDINVDGTIKLPSEEYNGGGYDN